MPESDKILKEPTQAEIDASIDFDKELTAELSPENLSKLKTIAYYTAKVGLPLEESCKLVDVDYEKFSKIISGSPIIKKLIEKKQLEYKRDLLRTLSLKARLGDDKLAQWLLERLYPEQYSTKRSGNQGDDNDILFQAISFIQEHGDSKPLVNKTSGKAISVKGKNKNIIQALKDILV